MWRDEVHRRLAAAGAWLGDMRRAALLMQSSGVGNIVNALVPVYPRAAFDYIGLALLAAVVVMQWLRRGQVYAGAG